MDWGGGAVFGGLMVVLALVLGMVYLVSRVRHGRAPDHAQSHEHVGPDPTGDQDPIPRESGGGMPMALPDDGERPSVDDLQDKARGRANQDQPDQHQVNRNAS